MLFFGLVFLVALLGGVILSEKEAQKKGGSLSQHMHGGNTHVHTLHRHSNRCDGNCAVCPSHYGYRYGRWYYGKGHQRGCERGGNGGASGHYRGY